MDSTSLTHKPIPLLLRQLAIPSSLGMLFNTLYNIVDTYYAGLISTEALAALSASSFLFFFIIGMAYGGTSALTALIGHAYGKQHLFLASIIAKKGVALVVTVGIFLGLLGFCFASELLTWIGTEEHYHALALDYIKVILLGTFFFLCQFLHSTAFCLQQAIPRVIATPSFFGFFSQYCIQPSFHLRLGICPCDGHRRHCVCHGFSPSD